MATYRRTDRAERVTAVDGSHEDARLAASDAWQRVDEPAPAAAMPAPDRGALKAEWEAHARRLGVPSYEIDDMTKAELIERTTGDGED